MKEWVNTKIVHTTSTIVIL